MNQQATMIANSSEIPNSSFRNYLGEMTAEIVASGNPNGDLIAEMQAAHARRQSVAKEMALGKTERARIARRIIAAQVWGNVRAGAAVDSAIRDLSAELRPDRSHEELVAILEGGDA